MLILNKLIYANGLHSYMLSINHVQYEKQMVLIIDKTSVEPNLYYYEIGQYNYRIIAIASDGLL